ncbi:hypothetical protein V2I01_41005 [Micromonospora sp. BRA006-A]|nr:hypothetical protein [Micromonospora sp. BRA006-A]
MIVWLNGAFGVGKTTTARLLTNALPDARLFDPEFLGSMLTAFVTRRPATSRICLCGVTSSCRRSPGWTGTTRASGSCR